MHQPAPAAHRGVLGVSAGVWGLPPLLPFATPYCSSPGSAQARPRCVPGGHLHSSGCWSRRERQARAGANPTSQCCSEPRRTAAAATTAALQCLAEGADARAKDSRVSEQLHHAACNQNAEAAAFSSAQVAAGADVQARTTGGVEPLQQAPCNQIPKAAVAAIHALVAAGQPSGQC